MEISCGRIIWLISPSNKQKYAELRPSGTELRSYETKLSISGTKMTPSRTKLRPNRTELSGIL